METHLKKSNPKNHTYKFGKALLHLTLVPNNVKERAVCGRVEAREHYGMCNLEKHGNSEKRRNAKGFVRQQRLLLDVSSFSSFTVYIWRYVPFPFLVRLIYTTLVLHISYKLSFF